MNHYGAWQIQFFGFASHPFLKSKRPASERSMIRKKAPLPIAKPCPKRLRRGTFIANSKAMEGPSIVIACEEFKPFLKVKVKKALGSAKLPFAKLTGNQLIKVQSWGKHLLLSFKDLHFRVHFLMFGSYRIDKPRENRIPKLQLEYPDHKIYFYSCAIKQIEASDIKEYEWSIDLMSPKWDPKKAQSALRARPDSQVADLLMDQNIFSGLGNIMKNEILFKLRMHPETTVGELTTARIKKLVEQSEAYAWQFYEWKKANVLKRNWQIMRKKTCPICERKVKKKATGKLQRFSHFCAHCQEKK